MVTGLIIFFVWLVGTFLGMVTGIGGPLLTVPIMAALKGMHCAVPAGNLQSFCISVLLVWCFGRHLRVRPVICLLLCSIPGILLGEVILLTTGTRPLSGLLGIYLIAVVLWNKVSPAATFKGKGTFFTAATGFATGVGLATISASGPIVGVYSTLMGWNKDEVRAGLGCIFLVIAFCAVALEAWHGLYTPEVFDCLAWALPGMAVGLAVGFPCAKHISQSRYTGLVMAVIFAAGVVSLINALR